MRKRPALAAASAAAALAACATYHPAPLEPLDVLAALEAVAWEPSAAPGASEPSAAPGADGEAAVGPRELSAFAVTASPALAAARAELGVRRALLVEAGLLPDPQLSWDAMEVLAAQITEGTSSSTEFLSGLGLSVPLLRPGERDARVGGARWRVEETRRRVAAAEWTLARDVHVAFEEVRAAEALLEQTRDLARLAETTNDYFERAQEAGAATAIQAHLAQGELYGLRLDTVHAEARARQARQALNALLGLPPGAEVALRARRDPADSPALRADPAALTERAVAARPDLAALLASYRAAEEDVRLAVASQFPRIAVGTGLSITLPLFSLFGGPARNTAVAERERVGRELVQAVHAARREIAELHTLWQLAVREVELVERDLLPNAERNLELSREALRAGEVTLLETLALQRALVAARTRRTEARAERSKRAWSLLAASGRLLGAEPPAATDANDGEDTP